MAKVAPAGSGLLGPFPLTEDSIAEHVEAMSIGAFAVGPLREGPKGRMFYVRRVGRDDRDLAGALRALIGQERCDAFKVRTYVSTRKAFEKECQLFHDFRPADTKAHPVRPPGTKYVCPVRDCPEGGEPWGGAPGRDEGGGPGRGAS